MRIEFPLLSIFSVILLAFFAIQGDLPEMYSLEVGFQCDSQGIEVTIDPTFLVWSDLEHRNLPKRCRYAHGFAMGNVIVANSRNKDLAERENVYGKIDISFLLAHEAGHVRQQRALGLWLAPIALVEPWVLNIEGRPYYSMSPSTDEERHKCQQQNLAAMWAPPPGWVDQWRFLTLSW